jgi:hypothetical protein
MDKDETYSFILKKFLAFFNRHYTSQQNLVPFIRALRTGNKQQLKETIFKHLKYSIG